MGGFKSEAQRQKALQAVKEGKMQQWQFDLYNRDTPAKLPPRLHPKKPPTGKKKPRTVVK